jgi:hypothetical protein
MKITLPLQHFVAESKVGIEGRSKPRRWTWLGGRELRMQVAFPGRR